MAAAAHSFSNRRAMIGKVHVAKKELGLDDDSYAAVIARAANGKLSSADCTDAELVAVIEEFRKLGWQAKPKNPAPRHADHATARKARALWISLHQLGAIENGSEKALEAFATRQTGVDRMQWTDEGLMYKLIEALNAIARRNGWDAKHKSLKTVKARLAAAILSKLKEKGYAAEGWSLSTAAERIAGITPQYRNVPEWWDMGELEAVIGKFAHLLRTGKKD